MCHEAWVTNNKYINLIFNYYGRNVKQIIILKYFFYTNQFGNQHVHLERQNVRFA